MTDNPQKLLEKWIFRQLSGDDGQWLSEQISKLGSAPSSRLFYITFGLIPRRLGKNDLELGPEDLADAQNARTGWKPSGWSIDLAARILLLVQPCITIWIFLNNIGVGRCF